VTAATAYVCREFVEDVTAYLDGTLLGATIARVDAHLADCPHCREYLAQMRRTIADAGRLGPDDVDAIPADVRERLLAAFSGRDG
jgi:anti-sigma factor RsiW